MYEQVAGCVDGIAAVIEIDFKGLYQFSTVFKIIVQQRFEPLCQRQLGKGRPQGRPFCMVGEAAFAAGIPSAHRSATCRRPAKTLPAPCLKCKSCVKSKTVMLTPDQVK